MALRDQPYIPLYVQDYMTDEKLNMCSASTQGVYIKIMCVFHKSEQYGGILLKQKDKQNENICLNFACKLARVLPFDTTLIYDSLNELLDEQVLHIDGDFLYQKRMVTDNELSIKRSFAGKNGGKKTQEKIANFDSHFALAKSKANSENENENESDNEDNIVLEKKEKEIIVPFAQIIEAYNSICISLPKCSKLTEERKKKIKQRWNEMERDMSKITELFTKTEQSDFCTGKVKEWTANFDWLFENSKNWVKVVEGNYDNKIVPTKAADHDRYHSDFASDLEERWLGKKSGMA